MGMMGRMGRMARRLDTGLESPANRQTRKSALHPKAHQVWKIVHLFPLVPTICHLVPRFS
jgi:hypothetical protein